MKKIKNSERGFVAAEAILGIGIFILLSTLVITFILNIYSTNISTHRTAMATNYAVEIFENAKSLNYYDTQLLEGEYEGSSILGVNMEENYIAKLTIKDYNKLEGNEGKENVIKILKLNIEYQDGKLTKNIEMNTLKLNNNI